MAQALAKYWRFIKAWHLIAVLLIVILSGMFWPNPKLTAAENLSRWPWSGKFHSQMALVYFELGNEAAAIRELNWAGNHRKEAEMTIAKPGLIKQNIGQWEKALETKKYSRDILLKLAFLNLSIYQDEAGKNYFEQARYLDPTDKSVISLGRIISSLQ